MPREGSAGLGRLLCAPCTWANPGRQCDPNRSPRAALTLRAACVHMLTPHGPPQGGHHLPRYVRGPPSGLHVQSWAPAPSWLFWLPAHLPLPGGSGWTRALLPPPTWTFPWGLGLLEVDPALCRPPAENVGEIQEGAACRCNRTRSLQRHVRPAWSAREGARGPWGQLAMGRLSSTALGTMPAQGTACTSCPRAPG